MDPGEFSSVSMPEASALRPMSLAAVSPNRPFPK